MLQWKAVKKSSGGNMKWECDNISGGQGIKCIFYGEEPPTSITVKAPAKAASKSKAKASDGAEKAVAALKAKYAAKLGISVEELEALEE